MLENVCTLPLTADIFAQAIHPSEPLIAAGLSSGHVQCFRLPPAPGTEEDNDVSITSESGCGLIQTAWRTRRHKGSCRSLGFSLDGTTLYSAGTDGIVKAADAKTGQVISKIAIPEHHNATDAPSVLHVLSPQTFLLATDSSALHLYDIRAGHHFKARKPQATHYPHEDYISSLTPLPPSDASTSGFSKQWVTTGGTTLAVTDLRRGVLVRSEPQEEELLCSAFVGGFPKKGTNVGQKVLVGEAGGVITLWERGVWDDQDSRIVIDRTPGGGESIDCMVRVPGEIVSGGKGVVAGMGNGALVFVDLKHNKVFDVLRHDEVEGVACVGFDAGGRLISGGGQTIKVWQESVGQAEATDDEEAQRELDESRKRLAEDDSDSDSDEDSDSSVDKAPRKRRKRGKKAAAGSKNSGMSFTGLD
ncbi:WD40 repeat-like protein [Trichodelitschia bisporula]|uniref:WD repeat-containing protein JIP5 n=1 Tax=Trichodelitschia bisporula TaxID=703511 RepID=A0A6G1I3Q4_9PEZI|nr:WD40 repeat-like protein [Trichodelitschia bisporula]